MLYKKTLLYKDSYIQKRKVLDMPSRILIHFNPPGRTRKFCDVDIIVHAPRSRIILLEMQIVCYMCKFRHGKFKMLFETSNHFRALARRSS